MKLIFLFLIAFPCLAIDFGAMNLVMENDQSYLTRKITNNSSSSKIYRISVKKITNPKEDGKEEPLIPGELLFSPSRLVLPPHQANYMKFYYKGPADNQERYYRVEIIESSTAQNNENSAADLLSSLEVNISLQPVLVIRPRKINMQYIIDTRKGMIENTGNTFFEVILKNSCTQQEVDADSKFLLAGEIYFNEKLKSTENPIIINYNDSFINANKACH